MPDEPTSRVDSALCDQLGLELPGPLAPQEWHESSEQKLSEERYCDGWNACRAEMIKYMAALVATERKRQSDKVRAHLDRTVMSLYGTSAECRAARVALQRLLDDGA